MKRNPSSQSSINEILKSPYLLARWAALAAGIEIIDNAEREGKKKQEHENYSERENWALKDYVERSSDRLARDFDRSGVCENKLEVARNNNYFPAPEEKVEKDNYWELFNNTVDLHRFNFDIEFPKLTQQE